MPVYVIIKSPCVPPLAECVRDKEGYPETFNTKEAATDWALYNGYNNPTITPLMNSHICNNCERPLAQITELPLVECPYCGACDLRSAQTQEEAAHQALYDSGFINQRLVS